MILINFPSSSSPGQTIKDSIQILNSSIAFYQNKALNKLDHLVKKVILHYIVDNNYFEWNYAANGHNSQPVSPFSPVFKEVESEMFSDVVSLMDEKEGEKQEVKRDFKSVNKINTQHNITNHTNSTNSTNNNNNTKNNNNNNTKNNTTKANNNSHIDNSNLNPVSNLITKFNNPPVRFVIVY
jgi:hypothetical protein